MSNELIAIVVVGSVLAVVVLVTFAISLRALGEMHRMVNEAIRIERAVAGLVVQESEKIQQLMRA